jgi:hypothetical protein
MLCGSNHKRSDRRNVAEDNDRAMVIIIANYTNITHIEAEGSAKD